MTRGSYGKKGFCYGTRLHGVKNLTMFSRSVLLFPSFKDIAQIFYFVRWAKLWKCREYSLLDQLLEFYEMKKIIRHEDKCVLKPRFFLLAAKKIQELRNIWLRVPFGLSPTLAAVTFREIWHKLNFAEVWPEYTCDQLHMYIQRSPIDVDNPTYWNPIGRILTNPPRVIAQQYSPITFVSLTQGKFQHPSQKCCLILYYF
jgi:hypothetical protein